MTVTNSGVGCVCTVTGTDVSGTSANTAVPLADGPCANAVKDAQRTKLQEGATRTLWLIWGPRAHADQVTAARAFAHALLERLGAGVSPCELRAP